MITAAQLWRRLRFLLGRARRPGGVDEEMRFHLDMLTASLVREGLPPDQARARAEREFGSPLLVREQVGDAHGATGLDDWTRDIRFGVRALRGAPGFTALALTTLALGIGGVIAVFSLVYGSLLAPLPYRNPESLVALYQTDSTARPFALSVLNYRDWRDQNRTLEAMAAVSEARVTLLGGDESLLANVAYVTGEFFSILGVAPFMGRVILPTDHAGENPPVVVLSHALWQRAFGGDPGVLGRAVRFGRGLDHIIVGIMPPHRSLPANSEFWASREPAGRASRVAISEYVVARLRPGVTPEEAEADLDRVAAGLKLLYPRHEDNQATRASVVPLADDLRAGAATPLLILQVGTGLVLLIACANLAAAGLARSTRRQREMAIRGALGAGRGRLVRQLAVEHLLLGAAGGLLGLGVGWLALRALRAALPVAYLVGQGGGGIVLPVALMAVALTLGVAVAVGVAPAMAAARVDLREAIGNGSAGATGRGRLAWTLVGVETGLAMVLIVTTGLFLATLNRMLGIDPGFDSRNVLTAQLSLPMPRYADSTAVRRYWDEVLGATRSVPGVRTASIVNFVPLGPAGAGFIEIEGGGSGDPVGSGYRLVADDYFNTMGLRLATGRTFGPGDRAGGVEVTVINEAMARRYWPGQDPLGKRFKATSYDSKPDVWLTVIGVVADVRYWDLRLPPQPEHYVFHEQRPDRLNMMTLVVSTERAVTDLQEPIRAVLRGVDPEVVPEISSIADRVDASTAMPRVFARIIGGFAAFALLLAAIGVYGVLAYVTGSRRREFGVRLALGAEPGRIQREVVWRAMQPVVIGALLGMAAAILLSRLIASYLYGVEPHDAGIHVTSFALLLAVAMSAAWHPARRMARLDPAGVLRGE